MKNIIPVVAACVVRKHPMRVLLHRKDELRNPELLGKWEFPGGMVEYGEKPEEALTREIEEELANFKIKVSYLLYAQSNIYADGKHYLVLFYECETPSSEVTPEGCEWVNLYDVDKKDCLPGTYEVGKIILNRYGYSTK